MPPENATRYLVTGAAGCIGAWTMKLLLEEGVDAVGADLSPDRRRLRLVAGDQPAADARIVALDITDRNAVRAVVETERISHVIHLAALQAPFCRADPVRGSQVNVTGTINVFEGALAGRDRVRSVVYASSAAVFGPAVMYPDGLVRDDSPLSPSSTIYGVFKQANEWSGKVYAATSDLPTVGLRPFIVYGPGRDQGMTSGPSAAILSAVGGIPFHIPYGGYNLFHFGEDVARAFIAASRAEATEALALNIGGRRATVAEFVDALVAVVPEARSLITAQTDELPFPSKVDDSGLQRLTGGSAHVTLEDGIARSVAIFRDALERGAIQPPKVTRPESGAAEPAKVTR
jgi:UDP-glucuronate 4-epimerase